MGVARMRSIIENRWNDDDPIEVCVLVLCFNHAKFIRQSLDSILGQRVSFRVEIMVHDDASTDGSADILREYDTQYPGIFRLVLQTENQYKKGIKPWFEYMMPNARGKYIAICDGDDYWTSEDKLQKQVSFLDAHPECMLTAAAYKTVDDKTGAEEIIIRELPRSEEQGNDGFDITVKRWLEQWLTKSVTLVFRTQAFNVQQLYKYQNPRDTHLIYTILSQGNGYYFKDVLGAYRIHGGGVFSSIGLQKQLLDNYHIYKDLYAHHPEDFSEKFFQWMVRMLKQEKVEAQNFPSRKRLLWDAFVIANTEEKMHEIYKRTGWNTPRLYSWMLRIFKAIGKIKK
jgi:glycosyltransferase involved in cell wall biosynthesis